LQDIVYGSAGLIVLGSFGVRYAFDEETRTIRAISVNFDRCAGCRTCETACSAYNHPARVNGQRVKGLGNPSLSNIRVYHFNPDVDVPSTCAICPDAPCIAACPVPPDLNTGRKALYRDEKLLTIKNDPQRCLACGECAKACATQRGGVIVPNEETNRPERMCTLCDGNPQCVEYCPFDALAYIEMPADRDLSGLAPEDIARDLIEKYYNIHIEEDRL